MDDDSRRPPDPCRSMRNCDHLGADLTARRLRRVITRPGVYAFEAAYEPGSNLSEHGHAAPFFTYVLGGSYIERAGQHLRECRRGAVIFHDQESHANAVGCNGTISLNVELDPEVWRELVGDAATLASVAGRVLLGDIEWPALRVWREFQRSDASSALAQDEAIVLLFDAARQAHTRGLFEPHQRLDRCVAYLEAQPMETHRLIDVARIAGVHPMHLARLFRQRFGCSMGEFVRRRRIARACERLSSEDDTITAIALEAGFADHAHFTRTFTRVTGCTPRWYRARMKGEPVRQRLGEA